MKLKKLLSDLKMGYVTRFQKDSPDAKDLKNATSLSQFNRPIIL